MARRSFFMQGAGERGDDDDGPNMRELVESGQALGPARPTPSPTPPAETSEWIAQPQANPFAPSAPLPVGPQPTAHAASPPEQEMGPPSAPEYNPLAGLPDPYVPPYAREGAQPTPGPGSPEHLAQYSTPTPTSAPLSEQPDRGVNAQAPLTWENFDAPEPGDADYEQWQAIQEMYGGDLQAHQEAVAAAEAARPASETYGTAPGNIQSTGGWGGEDAPGTWGQRVFGGMDWAQDVPLVGTAVRTGEDLLTLGQLGAQFGEALIDRPTQIARTLGQAQAAIREDPSVIADVGQQVGSQMWQDFQAHPDDALVGAVLTAATGGAFAGTRAVARTLRHADDVADIAVPTARTVAGAAASDIIPLSPNVAGDVVDAGRAANAATTPAQVADAAEALAPDSRQLDVLSSASTARNLDVGAPDLSGPRYQMPAAQAAENVADAAEDLAPAARQFDVLDSAPTRQLDVPTRQVADVAEDVADVQRAIPGRLSPDEVARASDEVEDVADVADEAPSLTRTQQLDAWLGGKVERRGQRRSARQPTNIARRIVGAEQKDLRYTWSQRQMTRAGDWIGGGPGTEGSPNLLRQYVRSRLNRTDTMPEFPEGTNRGLAGYERAAWRQRELARPLNRGRAAVNVVGAAGDASEDIHRAAEAVRNFGGIDFSAPDAPVGGSIYGDEVIAGAAQSRWRRPSNFPGATAGSTPASQAYGQQTYVPGRGHGRGA